MAYVKKTWVTGETIDAAKLNNIETGINEAIQKANSGGGTGGTGGAVPVNHASPDTTYGMGDADNYGHVRIIPTTLQKSDDLYVYLDPEGNQVTNNNLRGLVASAWAVSFYNEILTEACDGLEDRVRVLENSSAKTPVRGVDYWTNEDIAVIKSYVDDAILGGRW